MLNGAGVEAACALLDTAMMGVGLAGLELESAALQVVVEPFDADDFDDRFCGGSFNLLGGNAGHSSSLV